MKTGAKVELAALEHMTPAELRGKHVAVFGEPSRTGNKDYLVKRVGWRIQSLAEGGLSERAKVRAAELARDADVQDRIAVAERRATAVGDEPATLGRDVVDEGEVTTALAGFGPVWDSLAPREQARLVQLLVERVDYDGDKGTVSVTFRPGGIKELSQQREVAA
jgi:site-specific DNA recombinase